MPWPGRCLRPVRKGPKTDASIIRQGLPPGCETARLIDAGVGLEEISEAAEKEGLIALASMLFEAEQEQGKDAA